MYENKFVKVGPRGQITIPKEFRKNEGISANDLVRVYDAGGYIIMKKVEHANPEKEFLRILQNLNLSAKEDWADIKKMREE